MKQIGVCQERKEEETETKRKPTDPCRGSEYDEEEDYLLDPSVSGPLSKGSKRFPKDKERAAEMRHLWPTIILKR